MELLFVGRLVLTGLLYLFLAAVFIVLWRDMRAVAEHSAPARGRNGRLVVLEGSETISPGTVMPLQPFSTLGRGPASTILLADTFISAEHASIALRDGRWWLEDLGSRNGTTLNDVRIESAVALSAGDEIGIGRIRLRLEE